MDTNLILAFLTLIGLVWAIVVMTKEFIMAEEEIKKYREKRRM